MLKKENRLKKTNEIDLVFKNGKSKYNDCLGFKYILNDNHVNRFAIIVGKKIYKKAIERNQIKRIIKKTIVKESEKLKNGYDGLFIVLPGIKNKNNKEIIEAVVKIFKTLSFYV